MEKTLGEIREKLIEMEIREQKMRDEKYLKLVDVMKREREVLGEKIGLESVDQNLIMKKRMGYDNLIEMASILKVENGNARLLKLADEQKREREVLHKKIAQAEAKLDAKQALEMEIVQLKGALELIKLMTDEGDVEFKKKLESFEKELKNKQQELDCLESLNLNLAIKERVTNDELLHLKEINMLKLVDAKKDQEKISQDVTKLEEKVALQLEVLRKRGLVTDEGDSFEKKRKDKELQLGGGNALRRSNL